MTMRHAIDLTEPSGARRIWLMVAGWTAVGAIMALILRTQDGIPLPAAFIGALFNFYTTGALVWIMCRVHIRFELWKEHPATVFTIHAASGALALTVWSAVQLGLMRASVGPNFWQVIYADTWMFQLLSAAMTYAAGVGLGLTLQGFDRERERQHTEAQLEVAAREAELLAFKAQLQPHFLLNSLNSILALIRHDSAEAERMVTRLASLLRSVFDRLDEQLVPLDPELDMIRDYLEIERIRFHDRLRFTVGAEGEAGTVLVPPLLLQPIVENAMRHGIEPYAQPGEIRVSAAQVGGRLHITVTDSGNGQNGTTTAGTGRGIELTRRRLDAVYGDSATSLQMQCAADGFRVTFDLPVRRHVH